MNAKQVRLAEDFICISVFCVFELVCVSICYITEFNDSDFL